MTTEVPNNGYTPEQELNLGGLIDISVRKKINERGSTPYYFSYSFKGERPNWPIVPETLIKVAAQLAERIETNAGTIIAMDRGGTALGLALSIVTGKELFVAFGSPVKKTDGMPGRERSLNQFYLITLTHGLLISKVLRGKSYWLEGQLRSSVLQRLRGQGFSNEAIQAALSKLPNEFFERIANIHTVPR